jgi:hypothetical protein
MNKMIAAVGTAACLLCSTAAHATPYELDFTTSNFGSGIFSGTTAPQNLITGSIFFTAPSLGAAVTSIDKVNLTIDGYAYKAAEIGAGLYGDGYYFGAKVNGIGVTNYASDDFYLILSSSNNVFAYAVNQGYDTWVSRTISANYAEVTQAAAVPEPDSLAIFGLGLVGLTVCGRRMLRKG